MDDQLRQQGQQIQFLVEEMQKQALQRQQEAAARAAEKVELQMQVANLQTQLAQSLSSAAASSAAPAAASSSHLPIMDTRVIGKPDTFHGDRDKFADWAFILKAYMSALDSRYPSVFKRIESSEVPLYNVALDPVDRHLSSQLYYILVMLSRDKSQSKISKVSSGEGYEAWRQFALDWDQRVKTDQLDS